MSDTSSSPHPESPTDCGSPSSARLPASGASGAPGEADVAARPRLHQELEETNRRLTQVFASLREAVFIIDKGRRTISDCNPAAERIFGYSRRELVGASTRKLHVSQEAFESFGTGSRKVLLRDGVYREESVMRRRDGSHFESQHTVTLLNPAEGLDGGVVSVVEDISHQKMLERRLHEAQKLEAVGRLAGGIAHDFNNLLTIIRSNAELLNADGAVNQDQLPFLEEIETAATRATDLTVQILAFGRQQTLKLRPLSLTRVVESLEPLLRRVLGEDIILETELADPLPPTRLDPVQTERALMNLVVNARDAMPEGGRLLLRSWEGDLDPEAQARFPRCSPGNHVFLQVEDTGAGMDAETLGRAQEPYFTTKGDQGGSGLGLAAVNGLVAQSGGDLTLESEPGRGTRVTLCFPVDPEGGEETPEEEGRPIEAIEATGGRQGGETLLVVEDDDAVRRVLCRGLEREGYRILAAGEVSEARALMDRQGHQVHLCITDLVLPGASGLELVAWLRKEWPEVLVMAMSGYSEDRVGDVGELEARLPFISKPFTPDEVSRQVRELLDYGDGEPA